MADVSAQPIPELGNLMTAFPRGMADAAVNNANAAYTAGPQTQLAGAQASEAGARSNLLGVQAQQAQFNMQLTKEAMESVRHMFDNKADEQSGEVTDSTETGVASLLNKKNYVDPMGNPKLVQAAAGMAAANRPEVAAQLEKINAMQVQSKVSQNQNIANDDFQTALSLTKSGGGLNALLSTTHPGTTLNSLGRYIQGRTDLSDDEKDAMAKSAVASVARNAHQYAGRPTEMQGDVPVDKESRYPVAPRAELTNEQKIGIQDKNQTPQTVTQDNRPTTTFKSIKDPTGAPVNGQSASGGAAPIKAVDPNKTTSITPGTPGNVRGLSPEQSDFVKNQPAGFDPIKGNQGFNADDTDARKIWRDQSKELAKSTNTEFDRAQNSVADIKKLNNILTSTPELHLGPLAPQYYNMRTALESWTNTPSGSAAAFQILSKVLNASEMNDLLAKFHSEGAQVRLGAYESRLIMEKLAANPGMTRGAITQMLKWQGSDAQYTLDKTKVAGALIQSGKSVANFDKDYGGAFPKQDIVDSSLDMLHQKTGTASYDFNKASGKTYTDAQVSEAAAHAGIPKTIFLDRLNKAGAKIN